MRRFILFGAVAFDMRTVFLIAWAVVATGCTAPTDVDVADSGASKPEVRSYQANITTVFAACTEPGGCNRVGGTPPGLPRWRVLGEDGQPTTITVEARWRSTTPATDTLAFRFTSEDAERVEFRGASPLAASVMLAAGHEYGLHAVPAEDNGAVADLHVELVLTGTLRPQS